MPELSVWGGFLLFIGLMLALDLGVFHRRSHVVGPREALGWSALWVALSLLFNVFVYFLYEYGWLGWSELASHRLSGREAAVQFLTGYLLEKSLSVDNIFVIAMIFGYFGVPPAQQHRVLFWGILGAVVLRGLMIAAGVALINRFDRIIYVFGAFLLYSAVRLLMAGEERFDPDRSAAVRLVRRLYPVSGRYHGSRFFVELDGRRTATPLLLALALVETSDLMFAFDSIPAILAITRDPFLVFTSNVFAILGLRSLYFVLAGAMEKFRYLKTSLVFLLAYIGVKMLISHHYPIPNLVSLAIIAGILTVGLGASLLAAGRGKAASK